MIGDAEDLQRAITTTETFLTNEEKARGGWGKPCVIPGCAIPYTNPETNLCVWHDYCVAQNDQN
jgi:hypothetical protein